MSDSDLLAISMSSFEKYQFKSFAHFLIGLFSCYRVVQLLLIWCKVCSIFSHSVGCLFTPFSLLCGSFLVWCNAICLLYICAFQVISKKILAQTIVKKLLLCFLLIILWFQVLYLSLVHFEVIDVCVVREGKGCFTFLPVENQFLNIVY